MLGWEFPPYFAGGVGTVCYELTRGLAKKGVDVTYVMPYGPDDISSPHVRLLTAERQMKEAGVTMRKIPSNLYAYASPGDSTQQIPLTRTIRRKGAAPKKLYGEDLLNEVYHFADAIVEMAEDLEFDVVHAHDWTTIPAALALKRRYGVPVVLHVHITEFDKSGGEHADSRVYAIEREGFQNADLCIAVSKLTKQRLVDSYGVSPERIRVVYNTIEYEPPLSGETRSIAPNERIVLFLGRITLQKGPEYFLEAAAKVARIMPDVKFVMAGTGDMLSRMIRRAADLGIGNRVLFPGFVSREQGDRLYKMADLFVMPSVSEPFGIVPLEAMRQGTPVIVSRQSGVAEVVRNALKVDFWDVDQLASKMVAALTYSDLHHMLRHHGSLEIQNCTWETPAEHCKQIYDEVMV